MPGPRNSLRRPFATLGVIVLVWLVVPGAIKRMDRLAIFELQAPQEVTSAAALSLQDYWSLRTRSKNDLIEALRTAGQANAAYEQALQTNIELLVENKRLESLLNLPGKPRYRTEVARVSRRDMTGWWQQMVIRKGRREGIVVDAPVIFAGGVVGRVRTVGYLTSSVELITSPTLRIAAEVEGDSRPVSYQGGINPPFATPQGTVEYVPPDIDVSRAPRRLVTSGLGGIFPAGLVVGQLVQAEPSSDGLFKSGTVRLDPRLSELTEVAVLVPIDPDLPPPPKQDAKP